MTVGAVLSLSNLYYWGTGPGHPWPTAHLGDLTTVSQNPKETHLKTALTKFKDQLPVSMQDFWFGGGGTIIICLSVRRVLNM